MRTYREHEPRYHVIIDESELIVLVRALKLSEHISAKTWEGRIPDWLRGYAVPVPADACRLRRQLEDVHG